MQPSTVGAAALAATTGVYFVGSATLKVGARQPPPVSATRPYRLFAAMAASPQCLPARRPAAPRHLIGGRS